MPPDKLLGPIKTALKIIAVGLALVIGIEIFLFIRGKLRADMMLINEALEVVTAVQTWGMKDPMLGGKQVNETLADATLDKIGKGKTGFIGEVSLSTTNDCQSSPTIPSGNAPIIFVNVYDADTSKRVCFGIAGQHADDIGKVKE